MSKKTFFIIAGILAGIILLRLAYMFFTASAKPPANTTAGNSTANPGTQPQTTVGAATGTSIADMLFNESFADFINKMKNHTLTA